MACYSLLGGMRELRLDTGKSPRQRDETTPMALWLSTCQAREQRPAHFTFTSGLTLSSCLDFMSLYFSSISSFIFVEETPSPYGK